MLITIAGMFVDTADARRAVYDLEEARFPADAISVAMRESADSAFVGPGSLLTLAVSNQASTTPMDLGKVRSGGLYPGEHTEKSDLGPIVAAGPLAAGLGGAALGISAGGLSGALTNIGLPNETARLLITRVRKGEQTLVAIKVAPGDAQRVQDIFLANGAAEVYVARSHSRTQGEGELSVEAAQAGY